MTAGIAQPLSRWRNEKPDGSAVIDHAGSSTWAQVAARADRWAAQLRGERSEGLAFIVPESAAALSLLAACELAERRVVLIPSPYRGTNANDLLSSVKSHRLMTAHDDELVELGRAPSASAGEPEFDAPVTLMTSGTTGRAKLVCHTWGTLSGAVNSDERWADKRWLIGYPIAHFAGLQVVTQAIVTGGTLVIPKDFTPPAARQAMTTARPTQLNCTPTYLRRLLMELPTEVWEESTIAQVTLGGEVVDQRLLESLLKRLPNSKVTHIYASTELGAAIVVRDGKAGFPRSFLDGGRLRVVDGELWIRRDSNRSMLYYAGNAPPSDDWVKTGDLVDMDDERVRFRGRVDDIVNVGGFKVAPAAVENVIREVDGVDEVRVSAQANSIVGNLLKALIVTASTDEAGLRQAIEKRCEERLPYYMRPRLYLFTNELPVTPSQKLVRHP